MAGKKPIILEGGLKDRAVKKIGKRKPLALWGAEGKLFDVELTAERGEKTKSRRMVEKKFKPGFSPYYSQMTNPIKQFNLIQELKKLNREKKLGLRIAQTVRLWRIKGKKARLVITKLDVLDLSKISKAERWNFVFDAQRQIRIAAKNGYFLPYTGFAPVRDKDSGKITAVLSTFGLVAKPKGEVPEQNLSRAFNECYL